MPTSRATLPTTTLSERLIPVSAKEGTAELMACLTLAAPSGLTAEDRKAWVAVARRTLAGIPADLLRRGCAKARETCRFPSEIVPAILDEVKDTWRWREKMEAEYSRPQPQEITSEGDSVTPEQMAQLVSKISEGLKT